MIALKNILVDIDAVAADHPALDHALRVAARCGARVKIVDVLPAVPTAARRFVTDRLEQELVDHRRSRLVALVKSGTNVQITSELLRGRPANVLVREVLGSGHDLLVRSHARDLAAPRKPFGPVDMELLRQCPCPVWLIGRQDFQREPWRILAAIHSNPADETEQQLNATILEWALMLKALGDAELTLLQAWTAFGAGVLRSRLSEKEFVEFVEAARGSTAEALSTFTAPFKDRLAGVTTELVPGEPEDAIPQFAADHGIDVVVMGTVARTGIAGLVMGNTAERVLQRLGGSVLAVKPPGFESEVSLA